MFADPQKNTAQFQLMPGSHVADIGAGSGFYTIAAAQVVGAKGRVYAVDVQKDLLAKIKNEAQRKGLSNIEVIWGNVEALGGTKLRETSIDAVIISNVLFQIDDRNGAAEETKRILKNGGRAFVIDWSDSQNGLGPDVKYIFPKAEAKKLFEKHGFTFERELEVGDHHYGLVYKKNHV